MQNIVLHLIMRVLLLICVVLYFVVIGLGILLKSGIFYYNNVKLKCGKSAGRIANDLFRKFGLAEDIYNPYALPATNEDKKVLGVAFKETDENEDEDDTDTRPFFLRVRRLKKYPTFEYSGVVREVKRHRYCKSSKQQKCLCVSNDLYDSGDAASVVSAAYGACELIAGINKPIQYKLISFFLILPNFIVQIGWIFCFIAFYADMANSLLLIIALCLVAFGFLCLPLNLIYSLKVRKLAEKELIKENIISSDEQGLARDILLMVSLRDILKPCTIIVWLINSLSGFDI